MRVLSSQRRKILRATGKRKSLSNLADDIYQVLSEGHEVSDAEATEFGTEIATLIKDRLEERLKPAREFTLRMSNIGKGARQLWYDKRYGREEHLPPFTIFKFIYGDIIESLLLFLARISGHSVTDRQAKVVVDGIPGSIDADIDGVTVDVKSASNHAFRKFANGTLAEDDPFGYMEQLAGYAEGRDTDGAFLAANKETGHIAYLPVSREELQRTINVRERIKYLKEAVESDVEPERCYSDVEEGQSGNRKLGVNCSYCPHKSRCWSDSNGGLGLRTFLYSSGPVFLTKVMREPKVKEVTF
jgi:hypothetical protein